MNKFKEDPESFVWTNRTLPTDPVEPVKPEPEPPKPVGPIGPVVPPKPVVPVEPEPEPEVPDIVEEEVTPEPEEEGADAGLIVGILFLVLFLVGIIALLIYCYRKDKEFYKKIGPWFRENCTKEKWKTFCQSIPGKFKLCWAATVERCKSTDKNLV
jgi:hypothetical protein